MPLSAPIADGTSPHGPRRCDGGGTGSTAFAAASRLNDAAERACAAAGAWFELGPRWPVVQASSIMATEARHG
jgi:hypothetical protein